MNSPFIARAIRRVNMGLTIKRVGQHLDRTMISMSEFSAAATKYADAIRSLPPIVVPWYWRVWWRVLDVVDAIGIRR